MTLEELQTAVVYNLGNRDNAETLAIIKNQTNFLIEWLASSQEWEDLQAVINGNLTASTYVYTLAALSLSDLDRVYSFKIYDGSAWAPPMQQVTRLVWNRDYLPYATSSTGQPTVFNLYAGSIYLSRTPDQGYTYQVDYYKKPVKVSTLSSVIPFDSMDGLFQSVVTALSWLSLGDREMHSEWWKLAVPMIESFNLDSARLLNAATPNRKPKTVQDPWTDPFNRG